MAIDIFWTKRADKKFDKIIEYLRHELGENVAISFVQRTYEFLDTVSVFPEIGKIVNQQRQIRGFVLAKQVMIFYKITGKGIVILNLFDTRQNTTRRRF